jgi:hypothetical protein
MIAAKYLLLNLSSLNMRRPELKSLLSALLLTILLTGSLQAEQADTISADDAMVELTGTVTDPSRPLGLMVIGDQEMVLHLGPIWFWEEFDLYLKKGEELKVTGEIEVVDGVTHLYPNLIELEDRVIELASESGIPRWTRGCRRGQESRGRGQNSDSHGDRGRVRQHGGGNSWRH